MSVSAGADAAKQAYSRPSEIEEPTNRWFIHPMSRALAELLIPTGISPNAVSVLGFVMAAAAAWAYGFLAWPVSTFVGFGFHIAWHVFDGADGTIARRTGKSSTTGELVDGVCDHLSHLAIYVMLGAVLARSMGGWAWPLAAAALASRAFQAAAYESCRRTYRWWVYGVSWIRQDLPTVPAAARAKGPWGELQGFLGGVYLSAARLVSADDREVAEAMRRAEAKGPAQADAARALYRQRHRGVVKQASWLSTNYETLAIFLSLLAGSPIYFIVFQITVLNLVLWQAVEAQARANHLVAAELATRRAD